MHSDVSESLCSIRKQAAQCYCCEYVKSLFSGILEKIHQCVCGVSESVLFVARWSGMVSLLPNCHWVHDGKEMNLVVVL